MKFPIIAGLILIFFASCQEAPKTNDYLLRQKITAEEYKARIKAEKKRQAELDLPYRIVSEGAKIESLAFIPGTDRANGSVIWATVEKNRPDLAVLLTDSGVSALDPAYRSVREKVPFMALPRDPEKSRSEFVRSWPYVKNFSEGSDTLYHVVSFGEKKETLNVVMIDSSRLGEDQWSWLAAELKVPAAVLVLVSTQSLQGAERDKFLSLVKKSKQKTVVFLTTDSEASKISKMAAGGAVVYEISPRSAKTAPVISGDAPLQIAKPADFGMLKFDWRNRLAVFEIRNPADGKVEAMEAKF